MTDTTALFSGMGLGGVLISSLGTGSTIFIEKKSPSFKSVARDFIIGAVLVALIMQLLPESTTSLVKAVIAMAPAMSFAAITTSTEPPDDMEVQVGVPNF
jgi:hypothetical protein